MEYRVDPKSGNKLSALGFGCMRFPRTLTAQIDVKKTEKLILDAVEGGVNYFDTAYIYGDSEQVLGPILHNNGIRDKVFIATKLPLIFCRRYEDFDKLFNTQLERLKTDYIDYYFLHNMSGTGIWNELRAMGIEKWIEEKKASGKIKQIGFSFHGSKDEFLALLEGYPWDFCQIQYNYMNINYQAGAAGLKKAAEMGLPVFIMEPLLGGKLATGLPAKAVDLFKNADSSLSPAAWALRWLWDQPETTVVLSGMNSDAQLSENIKIAESSRAGMLTQEDKKVYEAVEEAFRASYKIPCTGCNYCMPCPNKVNIPECFSAYNISYAAGMISGLQQYITSTGAMDPHKNFAPKQCVKCGKCERHCPQHIPIMKSLEDVEKRMEPFWFKGAIFLFDKLRKR